MVNKTPPMRVGDKVRKYLDKKKKHRRESYNDVLERILFKKRKKGVKG